MDGVENEGDEEREKEGRPASDEKVSDGAEGNRLVTDLQLLTLTKPQKSQKSQAKRGIIWKLFNQYRYI